MRIFNRIILGLTLAVLIAGLAYFSNPIARADDAAPITSGTAKLDFVHYPDLGFPEQDVFVIAPTTAFYRLSYDQAARIEPKEIAKPDILAKALFSAAGPVAHDPFRMSGAALGPISRGNDINTRFTDWQNANGSGSYMVNASTAELDFYFQKLIPSATYTVWCGRLDYLKKTEGSYAPCGAPNGADNRFQTDSRGGGHFNIRMPALAPSSRDIRSIIAIAYQSNSFIARPAPDDFGSNTHIQLLALLPTKAEYLARLTADSSIERGSCVGGAAAKRDEAVLKALDDYYQNGLRPTFAARQLAIKNAWAKSNTGGERTAALKTAWNDFITGIQKAWKDLRTARTSAYQEYRKNRASCGVPADIFDPVLETFDAKL